MKKLLALILVSLSLFSVFCEHDDIFDIEYTSKSSCDLADGILKIELFRKPGTFNIYCKPEEEFSVPLFSTVDLSSSTQFLLKIDERIYELASTSRVKKELHYLENGAQLVYFLPDDIRFVVDFSFVNTNYDNRNGIIKVSLFAINLGKKAHSFDLKGIFDTICGEGASVHFTTANHLKIRYENQFLPPEIKKERAFVSSDGLVSFQFVLDGEKITPVEKVTFANVDELYKMAWDSGFRKGRGFSNIRGYDNSGIMIDWPSFMLYPEDKKEISFYIAVAVDGLEPLGLSYIDGIPVIPEDKIVQPKVELSPKDALPQKNKPVENQDKRTDVEFIIPPIKDYQLDPTYIQELIDRIDALQSSKDINKKEIMRLNAELDAILEKLRKQ